MFRKGKAVLMAVALVMTLWLPTVGYAATDTLLGTLPSVNCPAPNCAVSGSWSTVTDGNTATYVTLTASGTGQYTVTYSVNQPYVAIRAAVTTSGGNNPSVGVGATAACGGGPCALATSISANQGVSQVDLSAPSYGWPAFQTLNLYLNPNGGTLTLQLFEVAAYSSLSLPSMAPSGLAASGTTNATLSWNPVVSGVVDSYLVYRDNQGWANAATNAWTDTGTGGRPHTYAVAACNAAGCGPASSSVQWSQPTATPAGLMARAFNSYAASLTWNLNTDSPTGYNVYRNGQLILQLNTVAPATLDTGLIPGQTYRYTLTSINVSGTESAQSAPVTVTLPAAAASSPSPSTTVTPSVIYTQPLRFSSPATGGTELDLLAGVTGFPVSTAGPNSVTGAPGAVPGGYTVQVVKAGTVIGSAVASADGSFTVTTTVTVAVGDRLGLLYRRGA